jgi:hypothetical protein
MEREITQGQGFMLILDSHFRVGGQYKVILRHVNSCSFKLSNDS